MSHHHKNHILSLTALASSLLIACTPADPEDTSKTQAELARLAEEGHVALRYDAGLSLGSTVPRHISVTGSHGETDLSELLSDGPAILVFVRSIQWCAYCQAEPVEINKEHAAIMAEGYNIFAISNDPVKAVRGFAKNQNLTFNLLSDEPSALIDAFDLRDPQFTRGRGEGVAIATVMVVDKQGVIRAKPCQAVTIINRPKNQMIKLLRSLSG